MPVAPFVASLLRVVSGGSCVGMGWRLVKTEGGEVVLVCSEERTGELLGELEVQVFS